MAETKTRVWGPLAPGYKLMERDGEQVAIHPSSVETMLGLGFGIVRMRVENASPVGISEIPRRRGRPPKNSRPDYQEQIDGNVQVRDETGL